MVTVVLPAGPACELQHAGPKAAFMPSSGTKQAAGTLLHDPTKLSLTRITAAVAAIGATAGVVARAGVGVSATLVVWDAHATA